MLLVRTGEILVGVVFVLAAFLKAMDMQSFAVQIRYYGVLPSLEMIRYAALGSVVAETVVGAALIAGIRFRGWLYAVALLMLVGFTGLVAYAAVFHDLKDCGCFGVAIPLGPRETIAKNIVMAGIVAVVWWVAREKDFFESLGVRPSREALRALSALACLVLVAATLYGADNAAFFRPQQVDSQRPFAALTVSTTDGAEIRLGEGEYLVAMLSATCDECAAAVEHLNELVELKEGPPLVGLVLGSESELENFRSITKPLFPLGLVEPSLFFSLISPTAPPPRFYIIKDGKEVRHWDTLTADTESLLQFVKGDVPS